MLNIGGVLRARLAALRANKTPVAAQPVPPAVDEEKLNELTRYMPICAVMELVSLFIAETSGHASRIKTGLAQGDHQSIAREAHILVSTAGNIGAMHVSGTARNLEHACKSGQAEDVERLAGELDRGIGAANAAFTAWISANQAMA